jgi:pimeloyl-ACP methyl ester carboxylesterase
VTERTTYANHRVAIIGHSGGGFIASTYPAQYHDVVAMVHANAPSGAQSANPPGNAAILSATAPTPHGAMDDKYGPMGDSSHDGSPPPAPEGYSYPFPDRASCEEFSFWRPGGIKKIATTLCNPATFEPIPRGEPNSYYHQATENNVVIKQTGNIPVLLADADHDHIMPGNANELELSAWQENCGCDVSQFILKNTGHGVHGAQVAREWTTRVVAWLRAKTVKAKRPARLRRLAPPQACGTVHVTVGLGDAGRHAKRIIVNVGGKTSRLNGARERLTLTIPFKGTGQSRLLIRIYGREERSTAIKRTIISCRALS